MSQSHTPSATSELLDTAAATIGHVTESLAGARLQVPQVHALAQSLIRITTTLIDLTDHLAYDIDSGVAESAPTTEHLATALTHLTGAKSELRHADTALRAGRYTLAPKD